MALFYIKRPRKSGHLDNLGSPKVSIIHSCRFNCVANWKLSSPSIITYVLLVLRIKENSKLWVIYCPRNEGTNTTRRDIFTSANFCETLVFSLEKNFAN